MGDRFRANFLSVPCKQGAKCANFVTLARKPLEANRCSDSFEGWMSIPPIALDSPG